MVPRLGCITETEATERSTAAAFKEPPHPKVCPAPQPWHSARPAACSLVLAHEPLQCLEGRGQQEVGGEQGAEAPYCRVQLGVCLCGGCVAVQASARLAKQCAAVGLEAAIQSAQLIQACGEMVGWGWGWGS